MPSKACKQAVDKNAGRFFCPFPGCTRSFAELWRLKVHYRAPPDIRGSGKERGHGQELDHCPRCTKALVPGKHHVGCSGGSATESALPMAQGHAGTDHAFVIKRERQYTNDEVPHYPHLTGVSMGQPHQNNPNWAVPSLFSTSSTASAVTNLPGRNGVPQTTHAWHYPGMHHAPMAQLQHVPAETAVQRELVTSVARTWAHCSVQTDLSGIQWPLDMPFPGFMVQQNGPCAPVPTQHSTTGLPIVPMAGEAALNVRPTHVHTPAAHPTTPHDGGPARKRCRNPSGAYSEVNILLPTAMPTLPPLHTTNAGGMAINDSAYPVPQITRPADLDSADETACAEVLERDDSANAPHCGGGSSGDTEPGVATCMYHPGMATPPLIYDELFQSGDLMFDFAQFSDSHRLLSDIGHSDSVLALQKMDQDHHAMDKSSPELDALYYDGLTNLDDDVFQILFEDKHHNTTSITTHMHRPRDSPEPLGAADPSTCTAQDDVPRSQSYSVEQLGFPGLDNEGLALKAAFA